MWLVGLENIRIFTPRTLAHIAIFLVIFGSPMSSVFRVEPFVLEYDPIGNIHGAIILIVFFFLFSWVVKIRFHIVWFLSVTFHVGHWPTRFEWKCRCHEVESTFALEFVGQSGLHGNYHKSPTLVMLWLGINSITTHDPMSAEVRKNSSQNERLCQTLDIGNVFGPTLDFKNSQLIFI